MRTLTTSSRERRLWGAGLAVVALIYATLSWVRLVVDVLRERGLLRPAVLALFLAITAAVVVWGWRRRPGWREGVVIAVATALYALVLIATEIPEERLHIVEYGAVGGLFYGALLERGRQVDGGHRAPLPLVARFPAPAALLLTTAAGWLDEGIQAILPNRVYDLRDVALNVVAGFLAIGAMAAIERARRKDLAAAADPA